MWFLRILATLFALLAVLLMGVILLQRGKGVGLSGAFGGAGGHTAFGAKTGDVLTWATIVIAAVMLVFAVVLNYVFVPLAPPAPPTIGPPVSVPAPSPTGTQRTRPPVRPRRPKAHPRRPRSSPRRPGRPRRATRRNRTSRRRRAAVTRPSGPSGRRSSGPIWASHCRIAIGFAAT